MANTIVYVVTALFTYILGIISKKTGLNNNLPIPIQNIIVGICSFIVMVGIDSLTGAGIEPESLIQEIIIAIGGAGTATLAYDADKVSK